MCVAQTYLQISGIDHFYIEKLCLKALMFIVFLWTSGKVVFLEVCVFFNFMQSKYIYIYLHQYVCLFIYLSAT